MTSRCTNCCRACCTSLASTIRRLVWPPVARLAQAELYQRIAFIIVAISWHSAISTTLLDRWAPLSGAAVLAFSLSAASVFALAAALQLVLQRKSAASHYITAVVGHIVAWQLLGAAKQVLWLFEDATHLEGHEVAVVPIVLLVCVLSHQLLAGCVGCCQRAGPFRAAMMHVASDAIGLVLGWTISLWLTGTSHTQRAEYLEDHGVEQGSAEEGEDGNEFKIDWWEPIAYVLVCYFALCLYFAGTGLARLEFAMGDTPNFIFLSFFLVFHCTCLSLLLLLVREEVRSDVFAHQAE